MHTHRSLLILSLLAGAVLTQVSVFPVALSETKTSEPSSKYSFWNPMRFLTTGAESAEATEQPALAKKNSDKKNAEEWAGPLSPTQGAVIETSRGRVVIELFPEQAPQTVSNFLSLVDRDFYNNGMVFHRVVPGFVAQTGDPTGTGMGGSKKRIPLEVKNKLSHNAKGMVAMARGADPDSATSQFYFTLAPQPKLDGKYAVFGKVISGIDVLDNIQQGDLLLGVRLIDTTSVVPDKKTDKKLSAKWLDGKKDTKETAHKESVKKTASQKAQPEAKKGFGESFKQWFTSSGS